AFLRTHPRLAEFFLDHGVDITVIEPESVTALVDYDEEVRSVDPLDYELRWTMEGETLRLAVDENLEVTSVSRGGD
ncbi:MAG: hypothetical protein GWN07_05360, partial [Actinobacteria bacterium]|nr:hypothetical protein [Actinomycetota bacterium]NIU64944.1 hypothetical protein [Actinomycetota bacterium]NIV86125.1 hypothetical protein [Actinomycetota bacterium]NIW32348.1 hypothetical protein [Actinomycetota bacterium]NIX19287.1 hypothetical protein [Actinomycetota bacterium]